MEQLDFGAILLASLFRWMHILAAICAVGGTIFARVALLPSIAELPEGHRKTLHAAIRIRWSKVVMASIGFLLISGIYNFVVILGQLKSPTLEDIKPLYHSLFGIKFLLVLVIFFIASALVGRSAAFEKIRQNARFWLTLNMILAILLVCISGVLRMTRDAAVKPLLSPTSEARIGADPLPQLTISSNRSAAK